MGDRPVFDNTDFGYGLNKPQAEKPGRLQMPSPAAGEERESLDPAEGYDLNVRQTPGDPSTYKPAIFDETSLGMAITEVLNGLQNGLIPDPYIRQLSMNMPEVDENGDFGVTFSLINEINQQLNIIRGLRNSVFTPSGTLRSGVEFKDAKYVIQANDGMIKTLMGKMKELVNIDRFQKIEAAVHEAIEQLEPEQREIFHAELVRLIGEEES